MDWIEQLTGLDPDHGNGSFEFLITVAVILLAVVVWQVVRRRRRARRGRES